jgi:hypothetical protein
MKQINFDLQANLGGLTRMFAIPENSFIRVYKEPASGKNYLMVRNRENIIDIYFTEDTAECTEDYNEGVYQVSVTASHPKNNRINVAAFSALERGMWLVLWQDSNGNIILSGNQDNLLEFSSNHRSGSGSSKNETVFSFSGQCREKSVFIELTTMDDI